MHNTTLLLNSDGSPMEYFPISTINWQEAIKGLFLNKYSLIKNYDDIFIHSPSTSFPLPSIVMAKEYVKISNKVRFSRSNLYLRDNYTCQYCGEKFHFNELTLDHVIPKVLGGKTKWDNIVAACYKCNAAKGHKLMKSLNKPRNPSRHEIISVIKKNSIIVPDMDWNFYLGWDSDNIFCKPIHQKDL